MLAELRAEGIEERSGGAVESAGGGATVVLCSFR